MHALYTACILHCGLGSLTMRCTHCTDRGLRMAACNQLCGLGSLIGWLLHFNKPGNKLYKTGTRTCAIAKKQKQKKTVITIPCRCKATYMTVYLVLTHQT